MSINLLPEDYRRREQQERERTAKRPKVFEIELSQPKKNGFADLRSDKPKKSFWEKIFGASKPAPARPLLSEPVLPKYNSNMKVDLLSTDRKPIIKYTQPAFQPARNGRPKKSFWSSAFGPARSPIKPANGHSVMNYKPIMPSAPAPKPSAPKIIIKPAPFIKPAKPKISFWKALGFGRKKSQPRPLIVSKPTIPAFKPSFVAPKPRPSFIEEKKPILPSKPAIRLELPMKAPKKGGGFWASLFAPKPKVAKPAIPRPILAPPAPKPPVSKPPVSAGTVAPAPKMAIKPASKKDEREYHSAPKAEKLSVDINLAPQGLVERQYLSPNFKLVVILIAIIIPALVVFGVYSLLSYSQEQTQKQIEDKQIEIAQLQKIVAVLKRQQTEQANSWDKLLTIQKLLNASPKWTKFFTALEKYTLPTVYYKKFSADSAGTFSLPTIATNYQEAAKQIVALRQATDFIQNVQVGGMSLYTGAAGAEGVAFELKITLVDNFFTIK